MNGFTENECRFIGGDNHRWWDTQKFQILCTLRQWDAKTSGASAHYEPPGETFTT